MSLTSASGSGGGIPPGWYTDPHDPRQLRWWSGEGWTEHVSPDAAAQQVAEAPAAVAPEVAAVPAAAVPVAAVPVAAVPVEAVPVEAIPAGQATDAPLPSRRALRDPATEAVESAESALAAQAAQQQADQQAAAQAAAAQAAQAQAAAAAQAQAEAQQAALAAQQAQPVAAQPVPQPDQGTQPVQAAASIQAEAAQQPYAAPVAAQQPSAPVPTLPVATTSFLEQQGYPPLDGAAAQPTAWNQPSAAAPAEVAPQQVAPQQVAPVDFPTQPAAPVPVPQEPAAALPPVETAQPNAWTQPVQPEQPLTPVQSAQPEWGAPGSVPIASVPATSVPAASVPAATVPAAAAPAPGMDSLFGAAPAEAAVAPAAQAGQWGLAPTEPETRRGVVAASEVAGSSSVWAWLIAISPILAAGSIIYVMLTLKPALSAWPFEAAVAAPYVLVLLFALADRAVLLQLGHSQPRSPVWALLSAPVYLVVRASETRREDGSGLRLIIVWAVALVVALGAIFGYGFLTHHALFAGLPT